MKEIKFRAKRLDNGEWVSGSGLLVADDFCVIDRETEMYVDEKYEWAGNTHFFRVAGAMCDLKTIGQYTGLKDKNGKEIYEGDVLEITALDFLDKAKNKKNFIVKYENGFICHIVNEPHCWMHFKTACEKSSYKLKKIGNIYDNPELVEG